MARGDNDAFAELIRSLEENLQGQGRGDPPPGDPLPPRSPSPQGNPRRLLWVLIPLLIFISFNRILAFYTDYMWYDSLGLTSVFSTRIWAASGLFAVSAVSFWLFLAVNVWIAQRIEPRGLAGTGLQEVADALGVRSTSLILFGGTLLALFSGLVVSNTWETVLLYLNQRDFGLMDPVFQRDVSFFLFTLPIWEGLRTWLIFTAIASLVAAGLVYGLGLRGWNARTPALAHLATLGALILGLMAWQYRLNAYELVYSTRGAVFGAGYTDVHAQLPAYNILSVVTALAALVVLITVFLRRAWRVTVGVVVVWVLVAVLAGSVYPSLVQSLRVSPNELTLERPYIEDNIRFTRAAFGLDEIVKSAYDATRPLTAAALADNPQTVRNVRLWDYRPLLETYNQIQALRQYYEFSDVDIDRYMVDGKLQQVMLAARELAPEKLNADAQTWVNRKLVYTHGYGVAASPVAKVTRDGLPEFLVKDLPATGVISITQPQVYFGERVDAYVIAASEQPEFDYPRGDGNVTTKFSAQTGIAMGVGARLLFALRFGDINLLLNGDISSTSQLLWRRNVAERVQIIAPFLRYDNDPYIVVGGEGKLYWVHDAYTASDRFPYSEPAANLGINYLRNSVKVVTNAYDGSLKFYVMDENEPIIAAYMKIFPALFVPFSQMPDDLKAHIRYPEDLFSVQAEVYRTYHMTNADEFYNKEDVWAWPEEIFDNQSQRLEPYYVLMQLPASRDLDFIQILPFTPDKRENMIAWLAVQNDPAKYGQMLVYEFGKDSLLYGPKQIEARIDQDPTISSQLSLWNQQGSSVIRGNLLVIPFGESLLYVEPLYLQAESGKIPELKRVVLATADRVVMGENLGDALSLLFGREAVVQAGLDDLGVFVTQPRVENIQNSNAPAAQSATTVITPPAEDATLEELITTANAHYNNAQDRLRAGDWTNYGAEMAALQQVLQQLAASTAVAAPQPTPVP